MDKDKIMGVFSSGKHSAAMDNKVLLHDIISTYPYFQLAQVLYAREAYDANDTDTANRVKIASAYAPNRKAMYLLFKTTEDKKTVASEVKKEVKPVPAASKEEVKYNFVFQSATKEPPVKQEAYTTTTDIAITPAAEEKKPIAKQEKEITPSEAFLEKEILGAAAVAISEKELAEISAADTGEEKPLEKAQTEEVKSVKEEIKKTIGFNEIHSFDEWLKLLPAADIKTQSSAVAAEKQAPKKASDIINRFLTNEPRISRPRAEFFSPSKAARQSVTESDDLVSETLAKIFVQQGNLHRALRAYETLMLQNPEKKAYFAARIKEVRQLIESGNTKK